MQKLIKAIAEQAGDHYRTSKPGAYMWPTPCVDAAVPKEFLEKFAEIIIKECLAQIDVAIPDTDCSSSGAYKTAKIAATSRIKQHFGIKE